MSNSPDQFTRLIEHQPGEEIENIDPDAPLMPFPTSLILSLEEEDGLVDHAMTRIQQLCTEMGRDFSSELGWLGGTGIVGRDPQGTTRAQDTWMGKRTLYDMLYRNEVGWRPSLLGGIFLKTNLVVPAARRICRQMIARAVNYFFGTSPWFAVYPVGMMDRDEADQADRYTRWKMDQAKFQRTEEQATERAFVLGEGVIKTSWAQRESIYKTKALVLVDQDGNDILDANGDYIMESDKWRTDTVTNPDGSTTTGNLQVLERDGKTPQPPEPMIYVEKIVTRRNIHYKGPEGQVINFRDFLCPLDAPTIQEADCCVHLYDLPAMDLADQFKKAIPKDATAEERLEANRKAVQMLRRIGTGSGMTESGQNSAEVDPSANRSQTPDASQPILQIAEIHLRYDCNGDGLQENITLILDRTTQVPIFYDYTENVTPDGLRPFSCVRVNEVIGRWYGIGAMEMFQSSQEIIDLWMNRKNFAVSGKGRVTLWNPHLTVEGKSNPHLKLNDGSTYTLNSGAKPEEVLSVIYLDDNRIDDLQSMIEFSMQMMMNESGIANANDGNVAGMDSTKLATGIRNIEKSGQELFGLYLGHLEPGITEALEKMVKILFANMDKMEVHRYFEEGEAAQDPTTGEVTQGEGVKGLQEINPADLANLQINTRILLTRRRGEQVIESNSRIIELVEKFYSFPFLIQQIVAPQFIEMAKQFQCPDAEKLFIPVDAPITPPGGPVNSTPPTSDPRQSTPNL